jgi:hypothetical protein
MIVFAHITPKEVVYYITFHNNSMLTLDSKSLQIYNFLDNSSTQAQFISILIQMNNVFYD